MTNKNVRQYITSDFYLSAFLLSKGLKLIKVDKSNPQRALFIFEDREDRQKLVEEFLYSRASVNPKEFVIAIKELKQLLHSSI
jgi:predicted RNA-binding protein YlxR (DUF448 family)